LACELQRALQVMQRLFHDGMVSPEAIHGPMKQAVERQWMCRPAWQGLQIKVFSGTIFSLAHHCAG
jgi:hypothetical protein